MKGANNMLNNSKLKKTGYDLKRIGKGAPKGLDDKIEKGIDGIYKNNTPPPEYVIDEDKYGSSKLNQKVKNKKKPQMSRDWVLDRIKKDKKLTKAEKTDIKNAIQNNKVDYVVSKIDAKGKVATYKVNETVDASGNVHTSIGSKWP